MPWPISEIIIQINEEKTNLLELFSDAKLNPDKHVIPTVWPESEPQGSPCCGLYSIRTSFRYNDAKREVIHVRKQKKYDSSIRQIAKKLTLPGTKQSLTAFGEIFNVDSFAVLADHLKYPGCKVIRLNNPSEQEYSQTICNLLENNYMVIVSCETNLNNMPQPSRGFNAHWAPIFSYFYLGKDLYFIVTQSRQFLGWPACKLFETNEKLSESNPNKVFYKNKEKNYILLEKDKKVDDAISTVTVAESTLKNFKFTMFAVPAPKLKKRINFNLKEWRELQLIHFAQQGQLEKIIELQKIDPKISLNAKDNSGDTALTWAAIRGHIDVMTWLIKNNADPSICDRNSDNYKQCFDYYLKRCMKEFKLAEISEILKHKEQLKMLKLVHFPCFKEQVKLQIQDYIFQGDIGKITKIIECLPEHWEDTSDALSISSSPRFPTRMRRSHE